MAITATDMVKKSKLATTIIAINFSLPVLAGQWEFTPSIIVNDIYTDNVELTQSNQLNSLVSQAGISLDSEYNAKYLQFNFASNSVYAMYSHDHDLDDDFHTLSSDIAVTLGNQGFSFIGSVNIDNRSRNSARNALADIVSADTVQVETYSGGLAYNTLTSQFVIDSQILYNLTESEDNIGNFEGYSSYINAKNGSASRQVFWNLSSQYQERKNSGFTSRNHHEEVKIGLITPWKVNPFLRYYDEDNSGNIQTPRSTQSNSYGLGVRWMVMPRLSIDISYNTPIGNTFDLEGKEQKDYIDASIEWQPSIRTSLIANYSQRFFGDTYGLTFTHKNRRLTNNISYKEDIRSFTRNNYQVNLLGNYWCPDSDIQDLNKCFIANDQNIGFDNYRLFSINDYELIEDNVFSLYKTLSWQSELALARTTFKLNIDLTNREDLKTRNQDDRELFSFSSQRNISGSSNIHFNASYQYSWLRKHSDSERKDRYRQVAIGYDKSLNSQLKFTFDLAHVNRSSNTPQFNYQEGRLTFKITKDF